MAVVLESTGDSTGFGWRAGGSTIEWEYSHSSGGDLIAMAMIRTSATGAMEGSYGGSTLTAVLDIHGNTVNRLVVWHATDPGTVNSTFRFVNTDVNNAINIHAISVSGLDTPDMQPGGSGNSAVWVNDAAFSGGLTVQSTSSIIIGIFGVGYGEAPAGITMDSPLTERQEQNNTENSAALRTALGTLIGSSTGTITYTGSWEASSTGSTSNWSVTSFVELLEAGAGVSIQHGGALLGGVRGHLVIG